MPEICGRLALGEPLAEICRDENMPDDDTVRVWMADDAAVSDAIARARDAGFDYIAQSCLKIADDAQNDYMEALDQEGAAAGWRFNGEHVQRSKLRIETRLKLLAKWDPKRYGERQHVEHSGSIGLEALIAGDDAEP